MMVLDLGVPVLLILTSHGEMLCLIKSSSQKSSLIRQLSVTVPFWKPQIGIPELDLWNACRLWTLRSWVFWGCLLLGFHDSFSFSESFLGSFSYLSVYFFFNYSVGYFPYYLILWKQISVTHLSRSCFISFLRIFLCLGVLILLFIVDLIFPHCRLFPCRLLWIMSFIFSLGNFFSPSKNSSQQGL